VCCGPVGTKQCEPDVFPCCEGLDCGVYGVVTDILNVNASLALEERGLDSECCVPLYEEDATLQECIPGLKPLNVILLNSFHSIDKWNRCCDADAYCDNDGRCVLCLPAGGVGCTSSTLDGACCGVDAMCGLNGDPPGMTPGGDAMMSRADPRAETSNMCCIKNGGYGCDTGVEGIDFTLNCCNDNNGYQCVNNRCAVAPGQMNCYADNALCLGGIPEEGDTARCVQQYCCTRDGFPCSSSEECCNSAEFPGLESQYNVACTVDPLDGVSKCLAS
jgi:hypothetical protein